MHTALLLLAFVSLPIALRALMRAREDEHERLLRSIKYPPIWHPPISQEGLDELLVNAPEMYDQILDAERYPDLMEQARLAPNVSPFRGYNPRTQK